MTMDKEAVAVMLDPLIWREAIRQAGLSGREMAGVEGSRVILTVTDIEVVFMSEYHLKCMRQVMPLIIQPFCSFLLVSGTFR